jgi:hypothetical protein
MFRYPALSFPALFYGSIFRLTYRTVRFLGMGPEFATRPLR